MNDQDTSGTWRPLVAVAGVFTLLGALAGFGVATVLVAGEETAPPAAAAAGVLDRARAHEQLDRFLDEMERWRTQGMPVLPGSPNDFEFLRGFGRMTRGGALLGVTVDASMAVTAVSPGSPAADAGVQPGDVILAVDGEPVADVAAVRTAIAAVAPGATYALTVRRDGREQLLQVLRPDVPALDFDFQSLMPWLEALERRFREGAPVGPGMPALPPGGGTNSY